MENSTQSTKKTYVAPVLTEYGSLEKLTLSIGANPGDAGGSSMGDFPGQPFMDFFSLLLGVQIGGVQWNVHSMGRGDFLRIHNDDLRNRQFAFVLYLSPACVILGVSP